MKKNKKSQFYQTAGVFYAILAFLALSDLLNYRNVIDILSVAGYALIAIPLLTKKKNILPAVGFVLLAIPAVFSVITYWSVLNMWLTVLDLAAFLLMAYILMVWSGNKSAAKKEKTRKLRLIPSILTAIAGIVWNIVAPFIYGYGSSALFTSLLWAVFRALAMYYAAVGIMHLEDAPAAEPAYSVEAAEPDDSTSEELKAYKSLLDNGIISQEEYDAKREELGL